MPVIDLLEKRLETILMSLGLETLNASSIQLDKASVIQLVLFVLSLGKKKTNSGKMVEI